MAIRGMAVPERNIIGKNSTIPTTWARLVCARLAMMYPSEINATQGKAGQHSNPVAAEAQPEASFATTINNAAPTSASEVHAHVCGEIDDRTHGRDLIAPQELLLPVARRGHRNRHESDGGDNQPGQRGRHHVDIAEILAEIAIRFVPPYEAVEQQHQYREAQIEEQRDRLAQEQLQLYRSEFDPGAQERSKSASLLRIESVEWLSSCGFPVTDAKMVTDLR